jgi:hypothetical protein
VTLQVFYGGIDEATLQPGDKIFEFPVDGWADSGASLGPDGTIYLGVNNDSRTGYLYAISDKGLLRWTQPLNGWEMFYAPSIGSDGRLYVNLTDGVNGSTGNLVCFLPDGTYVWTMANTAPNQPATIGLGNVIYVPSNANSLYALNPDKSLKWQFAAAQGLIASAPAIVGKDGTVYIGFHNPFSGAAVLYAIASNGVKKWELPLPGKMSAPSLDDNGRILFGLPYPQNKLFAVSSAGQKVWEFAAPGGDIFSEVYNYSPPVVGTDGTIYLSCNRRLYAVDSAGKKKWLRDTVESLASRPFYNAPAVDAQGNVYFGTFGTIGAGRIISLAPTGTLNWEANLGGQALGYPILQSPGRIIVTARDSQKLYVFKTPAGPANSVWPLGRVNAQNTGSIQLDAGPTVTVNQGIAQPDPTSASIIHFTVVFSKPVTGFGSADVLFGGTAVPTGVTVSGSGAVYDIAVTGMSKSGTVSASIAAGAAQDANGVGNFASTSVDNTVNYLLPDVTRPSVIINKQFNQPDPASTGPILFTVTFSEPVFGFSSEDVFVSGTAGPSTVVVTGSGASYQVAVSGMVQAGTVSAVVPQGGAQDAGGNLNFASTSLDNVVNYQPISRYNIALSIFPTTGGTVTGGGIIQAQSTAQVTATPHPGFSFESWTENGVVVSLSPQHSFIVTGARSLTAIFVKCNALLSSPIANDSVQVPIPFEWNLLGGCDNQIFLATSATPQRVYAVNQTFGSGAQSFTVDKTEWLKAVQLLGVVQRYYWTIGQAGSSGSVIYADWRSFKVAPLDLAPPLLSIIKPLDGQVVETNRIDVAGSATDEDRGASGIVSVKINGVEAAGSVATGSATAQWSLPFTLQPGSNLITVVATDGLNNQTGRQLYVTYVPAAPRIVSWVILRRNLTMTLKVQPGASFVVETSSDLQSWETYFSGAAPTGSATFSSSLSGPEPNFFRVRTP